MCVEAEGMRNALCFPCSLVSVHFPKQVDRKYGDHKAVLIAYYLDLHFPLAFSLHNFNFKRNYTVKTRHVQPLAMYMFVAARTKAFTVPLENLIIYRGSVSRHILPTILGIQEFFEAILPFFCIH